MYNVGLAHRIRETLAGQPHLEEKKMFGGVGFMVCGNMACGVNKDNLIVRVGADDHDKFMGMPHTVPFDIIGKAMKGWLMVEPSGVESDKNLADWVQRGVEFAQTLPPK